MKPTYKLVYKALLTIGLVLATAAPLDAQTMLPQLPSPSSSTLEPDEPTADKALSEDDATALVQRDEELALTFEEARSHLLYGLSLGVGTSVPWQIYSFGALYSAGPNMFYTWDNGGGQWKFSESIHDRNYRISAVTHSSVVGVQWYISEGLPIFIQPSFGFSLWRGEVEPSGSDSTVPENSTDKLTASFAASGPLLGIGLGVSKFWESGWFLQYSLFGFAKMWLTSIDINQTTDDRSQALRRSLTGVSSWGIMNLRVGYFF